MVTTQLPTLLYRAEQVRQGEQRAARAASLEMYQLMVRAGEAVFSLLSQRYPQCRSILICCGGGNNGGDGYVVARLALECGMQVRLWQLGDANRLTGDAVRARDAWLAAGGQITSPQSQVPDDVDMVVDALLGTGLSGRVREDCALLIAQLNRTDKPVFAVDVPSGLCADTGAVLGTAIRAEATVTFIGLKQGLCTGQASQYCGQLYFAGLGVEHTFTNCTAPSAYRVDHDVVQRCLPPRGRTAHKGDHGRVLCVGGDLGMAGAIRLASEASARSGAGLTAVITQSDNVLSIVTARPEIMVQGWQDKAHEIRQRLDWADVIVLGPGLGQSDWSKALVFHFEDTDKKMVMDADGLNLLALSPDYKNNRIITPHPGEAARLLGWTVAAVEADRFTAVRQLQQKFGGVVVLKGAGTLIDDGRQCWICTAGNPGMATGGMGDVLSGIIGALAAQGLSLLEAACTGVWLHSTAADLCACDGERGMLASDLFPYLRQLVNPR
ncbi:NAD(P)H-hydrate dehydratase [Photobacterium atrarenae]|uniref:Bifunctional NAD(P)H-hydrate repair enzyme n=1 Tax=Photobacterium atrarenae TaxID=865757 RepID=A0ABY5GE68_9GAMM|nr:NAD(P)H-hydrate dehydratase [Photobacterium atrarenae]UTV27545.1 NAD(P)H-hydrate dehydratase [Photobacterium atrarenae]